MPQAPGRVFFFADRLRSCALPSEMWKKPVQCEQCPQTCAGASQEQPTMNSPGRFIVIPIFHHYQYYVNFVSILLKDNKISIQMEQSRNSKNSGHYLKCTLKTV